MGEPTTGGPGCRHICFSALLGLLMLLPAPGRAEDSLLDRATEAFTQGRYLEAAALMEDAYSQEPVPLYLYNIGRAYEEAGRWLEAREFFESFMLTGPTGKQRTTAEQHLAVVVALLPAPPEPLPPPPAPLPPRPLAPWLVAGAGIVSTSAGGILLYLAHERRAAVRGAVRDGDGVVSGMSQADAFSLRREADTLATAGGVLASAGAAVVAVGTVWAVLTWDQGRIGTGLQLAPQEAGLTIGWSASF